MAMAMAAALLLLRRRRPSAAASSSSSSSLCSRASFRTTTLSSSPAPSSSSPPPLLHASSFSRPRRSLRPEPLIIPVSPDDSSRVPCRAMASCKHIRWCASLLNGARGRGFSTQSLEGTTAGEVIAALQSHVNDGGKPLLSILTKFLCEERDLLLEKNEKECQLLEEKAEKEREKNVLLCQLLENEREFRAKGRVELLSARGLNDTRGLFECLQENLAGKSIITSRLKGAALWEAILKANPGLAACIQKCTNVPASDVAKQALNCYNVFSILSQHVHAGKSLADLQVARGGTIKFERGPLSPEQVQVLLCIGVAAQVALDENTEGQTRCY